MSTTDLERLIAAFSLLEDRAPTADAAEMTASGDSAAMLPDLGGRPGRLRRPVLIATVTALVVAVAGASVIISLREDRPSRPAAQPTLAPTTPLTSSNPAGALPPAVRPGGPGVNVAATIETTVNGVRQGHQPLSVVAGQDLRISLTITPHPGTELGELYVGIAGPGPYSSPGVSPRGAFETLLREATYENTSRHVMADWTPPTTLVGKQVLLLVGYLVPHDSRTTLVESTPLLLQIVAS